MTDRPSKEVLPLLKALSNPVRLDILHYLIPGERCVCNIFAHLNLPQNLISHHLGVLRKNGFITARKEGKWVRYSISPACFLQLTKYIEPFSLIKNFKIQRIRAITL